jgi:DNA-binding response OmpR family regulator
MPIATILVVDDEAAIADMLAEFVSRLGHTAVVAYDIPSVVPLFLEKKPQMAVLDFMMPGGDGSQVLQSLRATDSGAKLPVVFLSAMPKHQVQARVSDQTNVQFMEKPVNFGALKDAIDQAVAGQA